MQLIKFFLAFCFLWTDNSFAHAFLAATYDQEVIQVFNELNSYKTSAQQLQNLAKNLKTKEAKDYVQKFALNTQLINSQKPYRFSFEKNTVTIFINGKEFNISQSNENPFLFTINQKEFLFNSKESFESNESRLQNILNEKSPNAIFSLLVPQAHAGGFVAAVVVILVILKLGSIAEKKIKVSECEKIKKDISLHYAELSQEKRDEVSRKVKKELFCDDCEGSSVRVCYQSLYQILSNLESDERLKRQNQSAATQLLKSESVKKSMPSDKNSSANRQ